MTARITEPLAYALIQMRMPVQGDDARLVYRLVENRYKSRRLHNLITIAVSPRNTRQRVTYDASRTKFCVLWAIERPIVASTLIDCIQFGLPLLALRC